MSISRRFFLIGSGAVITSAFVKDAVRFVERTSRPFLITPDRVETEMFYYHGGEPDAAISLGPWHPIDDVPIPTWREYYTKCLGQSVETEAEVECVCRAEWLEREELDEPMRAESWGQHWDYWLSPSAQAYQFLESLDLGPLRKRSGQRVWNGQLIFDECPRIASNARYVAAEDAVTLSLLQARLIELGLPYRLREGE
jgi:hypothetical protein